jgi:hypothetical protein
LNWKKDREHISRAKLATEVAKRMKAFFVVTLPFDPRGDMLNLVLN